MNRPTPLRAVVAVMTAAVVLGGVQQAASETPSADELQAFRTAIEEAASTTTTAESPATAPSTTPSTSGGRYGDGTTSSAPSTTSTSIGQTPAPTAPHPEPVGAPPQLAPRGAGVPVGKGMWIWMPSRAEGGDPRAIVARAQAVGLTHIYVRTGSSRQGFEGAAFLEVLLPLAHDAGIRVYGWDFPYLEDVGGDVERALTAINFRTTGGHRIDGFVPDIETNSEGTNISAETASAYSQLLRAAVGVDYPLIACVPHPSPARIGSFPYAAMLSHYDAVAPMSYWLNRQPDTDAAQAVTWLSQFGKPVIPVGQAYDGAPEGGRPGPPPADEIHRFIASAERYGATGVSFWSWQHATQEIWDAIASAPELTVPLTRDELDDDQLRAVQTQLSSMSYWAPPTGQWDEQTIRAVKAFQIELGLLPTGQLDIATRTALLGPLAPPIGR